MKDIFWAAVFFNTTIDVHMLDMNRYQLLSTITHRSISLRGSRMADIDYTFPICSPGFSVYYEQFSVIFCFASEVPGLGDRTLREISLVLISIPW
ncbi:hypothetical protein AYI70_g9661 [Smittium culicis]|uniref:Uncharacterized protein n=1 Tax=Smittium culicis TaxID=133412 RepID=A0A1R1XAA2_9FUNG|nr:hypothetical protein AYI70_g9661 [Smittium culicis]